MEDILYVIGGILDIILQKVDEMGEVFEGKDGIWEFLLGIYWRFNGRLKCAYIFYQ